MDSFNENHSSILVLGSMIYTTIHVHMTDRNELSPNQTQDWSPTSGNMVTAHRIFKDQVMVDTKLIRTIVMGRFVTH